MADEQVVDALQQLIKRLEVERTQIQSQMQVLDGAGTDDTFRWLAGHNRAYGLVLFWIKDKLREFDGKHKGLPS